MVEGYVMEPVRVAFFQVVVEFKSSLLYFDNEWVASQPFRSLRKRIYRALCVGSLLYFQVLIWQGDPSSRNHRGRRVL